MSCNSLRTNLVAEKSYGVSGIMGCQSYGIRGLRLYKQVFCERAYRSANSCNQPGLTSERDSNPKKLTMPNPVFSESGHDHGSEKARWLADGPRKVRVVRYGSCTYMVTISSIRRAD